VSYDSGLAARVADALLQVGQRGMRQKNVFGGRGFLAGKTTFVIVWGDGLIVKVPKEEYSVALAEPGVTPFAPGDEKPMGTWVVVPADVVADDPELVSWVQRGLRAIRMR
jgi:TfoX/Sxy family transcriptional regulator of competence genes